ncbi:MAG: hypothetical protein MRZ79_10640 [Bacteroidia bacterium]|nr:hypothetical protein [Bacteroidia bacterium]
MKVKLFFLTLAFVAFGSTAFAQTATRKANTRQAKQTVRIKQGVKSGELTRSEATHLGLQQFHIQMAKKDAKADGVVTRREKAKINRKQDRASKNIYRQKHDRQDRY